MFGELLLRYTIRLALVCLAWRYAGLLAPPRLGSWKLLRVVWTIGAIAFVTHVLLAFHLRHHWSHADFMRVTGERTYALMGTRFGEGVYFSYLFFWLWIADAASMWLAADWHRSRPARYHILLGVFMLFIAFNGAIVFEGGLTRWLGIPVSVFLILLATLKAWQAWRATTSAAETRVAENLS